MTGVGVSARPASDLLIHVVDRHASRIGAIDDAPEAITAGSGVRIEQRGQASAVATPQDGH